MFLLDLSMDRGLCLGGGVKATWQLPGGHVGDQGCAPAGHWGSQVISPWSVHPSRSIPLCLKRLPWSSFPYVSF